MQPDVDSIHELFVGVEALGTQPDLHLGKEMLVAWCKVRTVRRVVENLPVEEFDFLIYIASYSLLNTDREISKVEIRKGREAGTIRRWFTGALLLG